MVAIVLTSVVAIAAYTAAQVSVEGQTRLQGALRGVHSDRVVRQTLLDLLHNARTPKQDGEPGFLLQGDTLSFVAAGVTPLDPEFDWLITLRPGSAAVELTAAPMGRVPPREVGFRLPSVTRYEVQVLAPGSSEWQREWPPGTVLPQAVAIAFWQDSQPLGPQLRVAVPREGTAAPESEFEGF